MLPIRIYNDLHNELGEYDIPVLPNESNTILSLAGDIYDHQHIADWIHPLSKRFKYVLLVLGNHDHWHGDFHRTYVHIHQQIHNMNNVFLLDNAGIKLDDTIFFGGTLWTDYNNQDPLTQMSTKMIKDYDRITVYGGAFPLSPDFAFEEHKVFLRNLTDLLNNNRITGDVMVISHMAPTKLSVSERYKADKTLQGFYSSDLSDFILDNPRIKLWHHGHTHDTYDYMVGQCRIVCNPRGYPHRPVKDFDPDWTIDFHSL